MGCPFVGFWGFSISSPSVLVILLSKEKYKQNAKQDFTTQVVKSYAALYPHKRHNVYANDIYIFNTSFQPGLFHGENGFCSNIVQHLCVIYLHESITIWKIGKDWGTSRGSSVKSLHLQYLIELRNFLIRDLNHSSRIDSENWDTLVTKGF